MKENEKVKLKCSKHVQDFDFEHALNIMRLDNNNDFEVVGNHQFIDNELIIKPSVKGGEESTKPKTGKGRKKVSKPSKDTNGGV